MSDASDLEILLKQLQEIKRKTEVAMWLRRRILIRVSQAVSSLKQNPGSKEAREGIVKALEREEQFLDMVRKGTKESIKILSLTKNKLKKAKMNELEKAQMLQLLQFLIDAMEFAKSKIKTLEKRIEKGEMLERVDYAGKYLDEFLQTLDEESSIDKELALILEGKSEKVRSKFNILKYMLRKDILAKGAGAAAIETGVALGGSIYFTGSAVPPQDTIPLIVATIIGAAAAIMLNFSAQTFTVEERRRKGAKEIPIWRRF